MVSLRVEAVEHRRAPLANRLTPHQCVSTQSHNTLDRVPSFRGSGLQARPRKTCGRFVTPYP